MQSLTFELHVKFMMSSILAAFDLYMQLAFPIVRIMYMNSILIVIHVSSVPRGEEQILFFAIMASSKRVKGL